MRSNNVIISANSNNLGKFSDQFLDAAVDVNSTKASRTCGK